MTPKTAMAEVINISTVPRDLSTGRVIAPGERARIILTDHERALIESGALRVVGSSEGTA